MQQAIEEMEKRHDQAMVRVLRLINHREKQLKIAVAFCMSVIAIGCAVGIFVVSNLSKTQHNVSKTQHNDSCWTAYNNAITLRALVNRSAASPNYKFKNDPALNQVIAQSASNGTEFKRFVFKGLVLRKCSGHNPHPPSEIIQALGK